MTISFLVVLLAVNPSYTELQAQFTLTTIFTQRSTRKEVVKGNLYAPKEGVLLFEVSSPVHQLMWIKKDTLDIYYPEEKKLFRIISRDTLPTSNSIAPQLFNLDFEHQLHAAGFKVTKSENKGDTLLLHWNNPEVRASTEIVTGSIGENFVLYRTSGRGWSLEVKLWDYRNVDGKRYPHLMRSKLKKGKLTRIEELRLKEVEVDVALPSYLADFKIPKDAEVKIVEW
ncbi:hypothetical protein CEE36_07130 [candidate division TA06 bacterium B3_TA06]|uniref:Outer membrane lipoprotein-sorting protein n=1 Tax=candidate division TA06 bacterium B3_TA06 TaxID=2012487 RepID=A0A532V638_UNCT6|nr:MAG: hypothetical protein CEE36_07130 [candidate division TA06 bacterium B3_TA06]